MDFKTVDPLSIPAGAALIDVREQNEWDAGHAAGAHHVPASELAARYGEIVDLQEQGPDGDQDVYIVCRSGGRSFQVAQWLAMQGIDVINVGGGMDAWVQQGLPIVSDSEAEPRVI